MEAKILDLKQQLNPKNYNNKIQDLTKSKDFSSTLDSVNNKKNEVSKSSSSKPCFQKDSKATGKINDLETKVNNEDEVLEDKEEEGQIFAYSMPMFLFANLNENEVDPEIMDEMEPSIHIDLELNVLESRNSSDLTDNIEESEIGEEVLNSLTDSITELDKTNEFEKSNKTDLINETDVKDTKKLELGNETEIVMFDKNTVNNRAVKTELNNIQDEEGEKGLIVGVDEDILSINPPNDEDGFTNLMNKPSTDQERVINETVSRVDESEKDFAISLEKDISRVLTDYLVEVEEAEIVDKDQLINQIVEKAKFSLTDGKNEIRIRLKPEFLGEMTMSLEVVKNSIVAKIMVDNHRTKEIIENNLNQLKDGLKDTQLEIKTFEVFVGSGNDFEKHSSDGFNLYQNTKKIRLKPEDEKTTKNYLDNSVIDSKETVDFYAENNINLFA